jgi:hypothetical protein
MSPSAILSDAISRGGSKNLYVMIFTVMRKIITGTTYQYTRTLTDPAWPFSLVRLMLMNPTERLGSRARISTAILLLE